MLGAPIVGAPGIGDTFKAEYRRVFYQAPPNEYLPQGRTIDGAKSRDPGSGTVTVLRPGFLLGKITASGFYAPSVIGTLTNAEANGSTSFETSAASVTELVRRVGASGTFKLTGPPTAAGTVRTATVTYSAASGTTITVTAVNANEVQTLTWKDTSNADVAATGGNYQFRVPKTDGTYVTTALAAWNATDATLLSNIQAVLDDATGVDNGIVVSGATPDTALVFTFSGTGYAGLNHGPIEVVTYPTTPAAYRLVETTAGVDGRFIAGSLIQPTDGSETPLTFVPEGYGITMVTQTPTASNVNYPQHKLPIGGCVKFSQLLPAVSDASLKTWIKEKLSTHSGGKFSFDDQY